MSDFLKKYLFEDGTVKVQAVKLHQTWRDAQVHHDYPPAIQRLLGELIAAATLMASNLKFDGSLVLQMQGDGPVSLAVVECRADLSVRATVSTRAEFAIPDTANVRTLVNPGGNGRFMVILDPARKVPGQQAYQGIVPIESDSVAEVLENYMSASEQLATRLVLAADGECAAGVLLQRLPDTGGFARVATADADDETTWHRTGVLLRTLQASELLTHDTDTVIHRLFWDESLRTFEPLPVAWRCTCSRERIADMLRMLGAAEVESVLEEQGTVEVNCQFCGKPYRFDPVDCAEIFLAQASLPPQDPPTSH